MDTFAHTDVLMATFTHEDLASINMHRPAFAQKLFKGIVKLYLSKVGACLQILNMHVLRDISLDELQPVNREIRRDYHLLIVSKFCSPKALV